VEKTFHGSWKKQHPTKMLLAANGGALPQHFLAAQLSIMGHLTVHGD
jgi:hypothetical protein